MYSQIAAKHSIDYVRVQISITLSTSCQSKLNTPYRIKMIIKIGI